MSPSGILAPPIKFAVSMMKFKGGKPSGAGGIYTFESAAAAMKSALSFGTSAITNAATIVIVGGDASEMTKDLIENSTRLN